MPRRRKCPTCWFTWLDKYNKAVCPKCQSRLPDGTPEGCRTIHTDKIPTKSRVGDFKRERHTIPNIRMDTTVDFPADGHWGGDTPKNREKTLFEENSSKTMDKAICPVTGKPHVWKFGKCRHCGVGEGYVRHAISPRKSPRYPTRSMSRTTPSSRPSEVYKKVCDGGGSSGRDAGRRMFQHAVLTPPPPIPNASSSGSSWRLKSELGTYDYHHRFREGDPPSPATRQRRQKKHKLVRKTCPVCAFRWLDKYRKNECPKCLTPLHWS